MDYELMMDDEFMEYVERERIRAAYGIDPTVQDIGDEWCLFGIDL